MYQIKAQATKDSLNKNYELNLQSNEITRSQTFYQYKTKRNETK